MTFTLGHALLIAPPPKMESPEAYDVCLPKGGWYDYWTGKPVTALGSGEPGTPVAEQATAQPADASDTLTEHPSLEALPVFVRAGTILPRQPLVQSTSQIPQGPLSLDIYPGADCRGTLYLDDGHSMAFEKGGYLRQQLTCTTAADGSLTLAFASRQGSYKPWWKAITVTVHGWHGSARATLGNRPLAATTTTDTATVTIPDQPETATLTFAG